MQTGDKGSGQIVKRFYKVFLFAAALLVILLGAGCAPEEAAVEEEEAVLKIVTTIYPLADIADQVGGDKVEVSHLLPAGASPHTYEPTVEQARMVERADVFLYVGADLDNWAVNMTEAAGPELAVINMSEQVEIIEATRYLEVEDNGPERDGHDHHNGCEENHDDHDHHEHGDCDHDHGPEDPHFWLDPLIVRDAIVPAIFNKLVELAPEDEDYLTRRHEEYQSELTVLHEEIEAATAGFSRHSFIAFHSAWQYFAERYGLEEVAVIAQFPGQEPSAGWIADLVELIKEKEIGAIFTEPQFSPELAERIAEESGTEVMVIDPLGGEEIPGRESYLDMMRFNLSVFKEALE